MPARSTVDSGSRVTWSRNSSRNSANTVSASTPELRWANQVSTVWATRAAASTRGDPVHRRGGRALGDQVDQPADQRRPGQARHRGQPVQRDRAAEPAAVPPHQGPGVPAHLTRRRRSAAVDGASSGRAAGRPWSRFLPSQDGVPVGRDGVQQLVMACPRRRPGRRPGRPPGRPGPAAAGWPRSAPWCDRPGTRAARRRSGPRCARPRPRSARPGRAPRGRRAGRGPARPVAVDRRTGSGRAPRSARPARPAAPRARRRRRPRCSAASSRASSCRPSGSSCSRSVPVNRRGSASLTRIRRRSRSRLQLVDRVPAEPRRR